MQREIRMERLNTPTCGDWQAIVGKIIDYVRRLDRRFYSIRAIGTGSNYEGTSIKGSDFDLMFVIYDLSIESPSSCRFTSVVALVDPSSPINITVLGQGKYTMDAQGGMYSLIMINVKKLPASQDYLGAKNKSFCLFRKNTFCQQVKLKPPARGSTCLIIYYFRSILDSWRGSVFLSVTFVLMGKGVQRAPFLPNVTRSDSDLSPLQSDF